MRSYERYLGPRGPLRKELSLKTKTEGGRRASGTQGIRKKCECAQLQGMLIWVWTN